MYELNAKKKTKSKKKNTTFLWHKKGHTDLSNVNRLRSLSTLTISSPILISTQIWMKRALEFPLGFRNEGPRDSLYVELKVSFDTI